MQLHRLTLCAVGPFADEFTVDFDRLGASGLFLLEGPTGAGKSSVIDAVVFALYGKVAGTDSSDDRMHSDFADPRTEPFVSLDFSTTAGMFRVRRTPKYQRPKQRGEGSTTQNATARLWRLASPDAEAGEPVTSRVDETSAQVQHVVGLSREQFVQTMVLPQGEFASFLRAPDESRRGVLQRLFGTELYERVQRRLEEQRREAQTQRAAADTRVREKVAGFAGAAGLTAAEGDELLGLLDEPDDLVASTRSLCAQLADRERALLVEAGRCEQLERRAAGALADGQQRERNRLRKSELMRRQLLLAEQEPEVAGQRRRLNDSVRAERVRPSLEALHRSEQRQTATEAHLADQRALLDEQHRAAEPEAWRVAARDLRDLVAALAPQRGVELELQNARQAVAELEEDATSLQTEVDGLGVALRTLPQRIAATRPQREQALMAMAGLQTAKQDEAAARQRVEAAARAVTLAGELGAARASLARATVNARRAHDREHDLRTRYLDGAAAALAAELVPDAPCPVCGSVGHPRPARVTADAVDRTQVEVAEAARRDAMAARDAAERRVGGLEVEYAILESLTGGESTAAAEQRLQTAVAAVSSCAAAATRLTEVDALLADLTGQEQELTQRLAALQLRHQAAELAVAAAQQEATRLRTLLADARGDHPSVAERLAVESESARRLEAAQEAAVAAIAAADECRRCVAELSHRSTSEGFDDVAAVEKALLSEPERLELGRVVGAHDVERAELVGALADPALVGIDVGQAADTVSLEETARQAARRRQTSTQAAAAARQLLEGARSAFDDVVSALEARVANRALTAPVVRMANLIAASGSDNARGMTLATFVLIERFRDVVAAANERLSDMSEGRYALVHAEDRAGQRKAGLGLSVLDAQTGQARDPRTLSGGETFYCSLALALGLADVVTGEAGGISLGTLFVDEGFGALDPETLEQVLAVLDRLRAGGRIVGVVSHVPELKERISERVVVTRNRDGSSRIGVVA